MSKKIKVLISLISMIIVPTVVFADGDSYSTINSVAQALLNALQWFGYAIALRNINLDRHKICYEWCK